MSIWAVTKTIPRVAQELVRLGEFSVRLNIVANDDIAWIQGIG